MKVEKANLDGTPVRDYDMNSLYLIDFSKMTSVNDLIVCLSAIGFTFSPYHPAFETLKPFLNLDQPIPAQQLQQPQEPKQEDLKLPKLKQIKK